MYRKPNENQMNYVGYKNNRKNQLGRKFSDVFNILMEPGYYEGTKYAQYFNRLNEDGTSKIYIYDSLEKELEKVVKANKNQMKYLVGLAGMGKTTLLRNFFKIIDRDVKIEENRIIIYISFFYANLSIDNRQKSIEDEIVRYLSRAIKKILMEYSMIYKDEKKFWEGFYKFIEKNKPALLEIEKLTPDSFFIDELVEEISYEKKKQKLGIICTQSTIEYYSSLIKYILSQIEKKYHIILIYDDIESKKGIFHKTLIEVARHIHSCFCAIEDRERTVKTIVALRAYTFRSNIGRQSDARREIIKNDTILKRNTVNLHDIFEVRFKEIEEIEQMEFSAKNLISYKNAKEQLKYVEQRLDNISSRLIYNLANYNLCDAMILYCQVMTNVEWIACEEKENNGSFKIDAENYILTTENIIYAIANGNRKHYIDDKNEYIPNILHNTKEGTDLIGLYIIRYMLKKEITSVFGTKYVEGKDVLADIMSLFVSTSDSEARIDSWRYKIRSLLEYLYDSGILLRSLYDIEDMTEKQIEREYSDTYKLYLSPRAICLYNLFSQNAVLMELYRDDIYTDLYNNDKLTSQLSTKALFVYLIEYLHELFKYEKKNITNAISNLEKYQELLGSEFITVVLLEGVVKNLGTYFKDEGEDYVKLMNKVYEIRDDMLQYSKDLALKTGIQFKVSEYLKKI